MSLRQAAHEFRFETQGKRFADITATVRDWAQAQDMQTGLLTLFVKHTTASLLIQENADPDVMADLADLYSALAPEEANWRHTTEGPDDMPGHVKAALSPAGLSIPLIGGRLALGTWQGIYLAEWRARGHTRTVAAHLIGE